MSIYCVMGFEVKTCTKCLIEKELTEYHKYRKSKDGLKPWCKSCVLEYNAKPENKARQAELGAAWLAKPENKTRKAEQRAAWRAKPENKSYMAEYGRLRNSGWTHEAVEAALVSQNYTCALCTKKLDPNVKGPAGINADHCHKTGKPRALLCHRCNVCVIGRIENAIDYAPENRYVYEYFSKHGSISQEVRDILETLARQVEKENNHE